MSTTGRSRTRCTEVALLAALLIGTSSIGAGADAADGSISISVANAPDAGADARATHYLVDVVKPGARVVREARVANSTAGAALVDVYAGGAQVTDEGFRLDDATSGALDEWLTVSPPTLDLAPGASSIATVEIDVPPTAPHGERYAIVWAQLHAPGDAAVVNRVGLRVYLLVDADGRADDDLVIESLTPARHETGAAMLAMSITNTGDRALDLAGTVRLEDDVHPESPVGMVDAGVTLAVGATRDVTVRFEGDVPNGPWDATAELTANGLQRGATAAVLFPPQPGETGETASASMAPTKENGARSPVPVAIAIALLSGVIVGAARVRVTQRRRVGT